MSSRNNWILIIALFVTSLVLMLSACTYQTSSDIQRDRQEKIVSEGIAQVGVPAIKNFRELKLLKEIYELRDQSGLVTYTYYWPENAPKPIWVCDSIGFPLPYSTQFTAPESMQKYAVRNNPKDPASSLITGTERLPQSEINGLFLPASADATWIMCIDPKEKKAVVSYFEPRMFTLQYKLSWAIYNE